MPPDVTETNGTTTDGEGAAPPPDKAHAGLIADAQRERAARQALEKRLADIEAKAATDAAEAAKKRGEFEALYNEAAPKLTAYEKRIADYEAKETARVEALTARNTARVAALPEDLRELLPDGLDPDAATAQIERLEARARKADPQFAKGGSVAGAQGAGKPGIPDACKAEAARTGKDPQWWFDNVWNTPAAIARRARAKT